MEDRNETISQIHEAMQGEERVAASEVKTWLCHPSLDVVSVATDLILEHAQLVAPPFSLQETCDAVLAYYKRCLQTDCDTEFVPPIHIAGYELVRWFRNIWADPNVPRKCVTHLKAMLADLYTSSAPEKADRLVNAVLEHLFETPAIAEFFSDWRSDPSLSRAFARAMEWVEKSSDIR
jgi:hypothetical protein